MSDTNTNLWPAAKVRWRCRRGLKELDLIFLGFYDRCYHLLSIDDKYIFQFLLLQSDPMLQQWLIYGDFPEDLNPAIKNILVLCQNQQYANRTNPIED